MANLIAQNIRTGVLSAVSRAGALLFGQSAPMVDRAGSRLEFGLICALTGVEIIECDPRSTVTAAHNSSMTEGGLWLDRVHVADRPTVLLALSQSTLGTQALTVRMTDDRSRHFADKRVTIQNQFGTVFVALQAAATESAHDTLRELAHELRTPLAAMVGLADALCQPQTCTEEMRQTYPALIALTGRNLIEMAGSVLNADVEPPSVELGTVAIECISLLRPMAEQKSIVLFNRLPKPIAEQTVDGARLRQIIINLISNAIKFSPQGASVELDASKSANGWTLSVTDNGNGIAPEDVARLGQKNFRSESASGVAGNGLGLSIVRRLVDDACGRISFESRPGKGTRVEITFPASTLVEMSDFQSQAVNAPVSTPNFNIAAGAKHAAA
jgi:signal transduction histidine kinase